MLTRKAAAARPVSTYACICTCVYTAAHPWPPNITKHLDHEELLLCDRDYIIASASIHILFNCLSCLETWSHDGIRVVHMHFVVC